MFESLKQFKGFLFGCAFLVLLFSLSIASQGFAQTQDPGFLATPLLPVVIEDTNLPAGPEIQSAVKVLENRPISVIVTFVESFDPHILEIVSGGHIVYFYENIFNGVSLVLDYANLHTITDLEGVTAIYLDELRYLQTDTSPEFIGAPTLWGEIGGQQVAGEGIVVGVIDTGIWPEHPSFSDPDPAGNSYPPPPGGPYTCEFGNQDWNPNDLPFTCNNKLIGAYAFLQTYDELIGLSPQEFNSARDDNGHGTHVTSIAAGNGNVVSSILGVERGVISGISPRSHVIAYRACAASGCYMSDALAATEQAMVDGVHVLNYAISGGIDPYRDPVELAFLSAYADGIFVAASAGNAGPSANTVHHRSPWVMTVGASTHTRTYTSTILLEATNGDLLQLEGTSLTGSYKAEIVLAEQYGDPLCLTQFPPGTFEGQIVACQEGGISNVAKSFNVAQGEAGGVVIFAASTSVLRPEPYHVPGIQLLAVEGKLLVDFISTHSPTNAFLSGGVAAPRQGDVLLNSSGRGGAGLSLGINKPDIIAPGSQILAGQTPFPFDPINKVPGQLFQIASGTSTASPHIAGAAALLKQLHPDWTPGQIKSALMTTALTAGITQSNGKPVTPFDYGAGRVDLNLAGNPGLTFSATAEDFLTHQDDLWEVNHPGLYIPTLSGVITVERTLKSELAIDSQWMTSVDSPPDLTLTVPPTIPMRAGQIRTIELEVDASQVPVGEVRHASVYFQFEDIVVRFPIAIVRDEAPVVMEKTCDPAVIPYHGTSNCSILLTNTATTSVTVSLSDLQPRILHLIDGSVVGATQVNTRLFTHTGTLSPADPPTIQVVPGVVPPGAFLPLSELGIPPLGGVGDESLLGFSLDPFIYNGEAYTFLNMSSNGYLVLGGGGGNNQQFVNQIFPDPTTPNNVIAPFWTDLNPAAGGELRAAIVHDLDNDLHWYVFEWEDVPNFSDGELNTFQIWIGLNDEEEISIAYGPVVSGGNLGLVTVGAENTNGTVGDNWFVNGSGTPVNPGDQLAVVSSPGNPGGTHLITYSVIGWREGPWTNCAQLSSNLWTGFGVSCFSGEVLAPPN